MKIGEKKGDVTDRESEGGTRAILEFSAGCNTDCLFCLRNEIRKKEALPPSVNFGPLSSFLTLARRLGLECVELGGDEPTVVAREVLLRVVSECRKAGFTDIRLVSNGVSFADASLVRDLVAEGVGVFILPIYGLDEEAHDAVTQRKGSFAGMRSAVAELSKHKDKARVVMHTILIKQNEAEMERMTAMVADWGLNLEIARLHQSAPHVDYSALVPLQKGEPLWGTLWGDTVKMRYNVLYGDISRDVESDSMFAFLADALKKLGMPQVLMERCLAESGKKPAFKDPRRLLRLLDLITVGKFGDFEFELLACATSQQTLALARQRLASSRRAEALKAFRETLRFRLDSDQSAAAKKEALASIRQMQLDIRERA